jgi:hypothetical protein
MTVTLKETGPGLSGTMTPPPRCPKCGGAAFVSRNAIICRRTTGGCGAVTDRCEHCGRPGCITFAHRAAAERSRAPSSVGGPRGMRRNGEPAPAPVIRRCGRTTLRGGHDR